MLQETNLPKLVIGRNMPGTIGSRILIREHEILCDEEPLYGGEDGAPDPYDYVLSAVVGCTIISFSDAA